MPSYATVLSAILLFGATSTYAAPMVDVDSLLSRIGRRDSNIVYILGVAMEDPCATRQQLFDDNKRCKPSQIFVVLDGILSKHCDNDYGYHGIGRPFLAPNLDHLKRDNPPGIEADIGHGGGRGVRDRLTRSTNDNPINLGDDGRTPLVADVGVGNQHDDHKGKVVDAHSGADDRNPGHRSVKVNTQDDRAEHRI